LEVAPFENKICFLTMSGMHLMELFKQIASVGGEGVSRGVEMVITKDRQLKSVRLHGKEIVPLADYRVVTIDYLAQGNDHMEAFKQKRHMNAPRGKENNSREVIIDYFKTMLKQGKTVDADVEGRIVVE
jgi:2',3'-cyclic-nucleotide 2'-phosphodiesterase (5'-nucleotidase family)